MPAGDTAVRSDADAADVEAFGATDAVRCAGAYIALVSQPQSPRQRSDAGDSERTADEKSWTSDADNDTDDDAPRKTATPPGSLPHSGSSSPLTRSYRALAQSQASKPVESSSAVSGARRVSDLITSTNEALRSQKLPRINSLPNMLPSLARRLMARTYRATTQGSYETLARLPTTFDVRSTAARVPRAAVEVRAWLCSAAPDAPLVPLRVDLLDDAERLAALRAEQGDGDDDDSLSQHADRDSTDHNHFDSNKDLMPSPRFRCHYNAPLPGLYRCIVKVRAQTTKKSARSNSASGASSPGKRRHRRRKSLMPDDDSDATASPETVRRSSSSAIAHHDKLKRSSTDKSNELALAPDDTRGWFLYIFILFLYIYI